MLSGARRKSSASSESSASSLSLPFPSVPHVSTPTAASSGISGEGTAEGAYPKCNGTRDTPVGGKTTWTSVKEKADVERRFHDLRHTACTRLLERRRHQAPQFLEPVHQLSDPPSSRPRADSCRPVAATSSPTLPSPIGGMPL